MDGAPADSGPYPGMCRDVELVRERHRVALPVGRVAGVSGSGSLRPKAVDVADPDPAGVCTASRLRVRPPPLT